VVIWSKHGADPKGSVAGHYDENNDENIGGANRAIITFPAI
jgi:hypothetical protein